MVKNISRSIYGSKLFSIFYGDESTSSYNIRFYSDDVIDSIVLKNIR